MIVFHEHNRCTSTPKKGNFKYLVSIIQGNEENDDDVTRCIGAGKLNWSLTSKVLCDKNVSPKLEDKFYKAVVRPTLYRQSDS